ncbi:hypothetical protein CRYUN_Cryun28dG0063000 [Craigia yunnanensis]
MASKLENNMNMAIICHALLGLLVGVIARTYFHGLQKIVEENESYFGQHFDKLGGTLATSVHDGFVTLAVKFLHFQVLRVQISATSASCALYNVFVILGSTYSISLINA